MAPRACILLAVMVVSAATDNVVDPVVEPHAVEYGPHPDHEPDYGYYHEPEQKVPDALDPIKLPPVIPNDEPKKVLILGKPPQGSPPYPFSPFDDGTCSMAHLQWPCPKTCSLEWNPVHAADVQHNRVITFINCCAWRWHVCHYKQPLTYLGRGNRNPCTKETLSGWSHNEWPKEWPKDWPEEWRKNWPEEWGNKEYYKA